MLKECGHLSAEAAGSFAFVSTFPLPSPGITQGVTEELWVTSHTILVISIKGIRILLLVLLVNLVLQPWSVAGES